MKKIFYSLLILGILMFLPFLAEARLAILYDESMRKITEGLQKIIYSEQLNSLSSFIARMRYIDGIDENLSIGWCSNEHWEQYSKKYENNIRSDFCWNFKHAQAYEHEYYGSVWMCFYDHKDCGYFTSLGHYVDLSFPDPRFRMITNPYSDMEISFDEKNGKINLVYYIQELEVDEPNAALRIRHWRENEGYRDIGPPKYPNAWDSWDYRDKGSCCEAFTWDSQNEGEWNKFKQKITVDSLKVSLQFSYAYNWEKLDVELYLDSFSIVREDNSILKYDLEGLFPRFYLPVVGEIDVEGGIEKILSKKIDQELNIFLKKINEKYNNPQQPILIKDFENTETMEALNSFIDMDILRYFLTVGDALLKEAGVKESLEPLAREYSLPAVLKPSMLLTILLN